MAPKPSNSGKGTRARGNRSTRYSGDTPARYLGKDEPKWTTNTTYKPPKKISDALLQKAKAMFFALDRDSSGSIDADELGVMLRSLGQNPSDEELKELIDSVDGDGGEKDGKIQLREFLKLYADAMGEDGANNDKVGKEDVVNVFLSMGGDSSKEDSRVTQERIAATLAEAFDLPCDLKQTFGMRDGEFSKEQIAEMLGVEPATK